MKAKEIIASMKSTDKDYRYMAVSDLIESLRKGQSVGDSSTYVEPLLNLLEDVNGEVRGLAVDCLGELSRKIESGSQFRPIVTTLMENMTGDKSELQEISALALKTVTEGSSIRVANECISPMVPRLCEMIASHNKQAISTVMEVLETFVHLLRKTGMSMEKEYLNEIEVVIMSHLSSGKHQQRTRTLFESFMKALSTEEFQRVASSLIKGYSSKNQSKSSRYIAATRCACRAGPRRFAPLITKFVPKLIELCNDDDQDEELLESCLQVFETFVTCCTLEMDAMIPKIVEFASQMLQFDLYNDGDDMEVDEDENHSDGSADDDYSRARCAAEKCLEAVVNSRSNKFEWSEDRKHVRATKFNPKLTKSMAALLENLNSQDLEAKRCAIMTLNGALQNKPGEMRELLPMILPLLYAENRVRPELMHTIEMGPFKTIVDNGLELRKSVYECMFTLSGKHRKNIDVFEFLDQLQLGLQDPNHDIKKLALLILSHMSEKGSTEISQKLHVLCDHIQELLAAQSPKKDAMPNEVERLDEVKRSALKTYCSLKKVPFADESSGLKEIAEFIESNPKLMELLGDGSGEGTFVKG